MIQRSIKRLTPRALVVDDELTSPTAEGRAARALVQEMHGRGVEVIEAASAPDGTSVVVCDSAIHAVLMDWTLGGDRAHCEARKLLQFVRSRNDKIPIFLMAEREEASSIPIDVMEMVDEYIWTLEDTAAFVGGRLAAAIRRYAVVTNSTYDGLCYNARRVEQLLDPSVDRIHFDEAWYAYARFNPLYRDRHAMHGNPADHTGPTIFATHSTHKLLAALAQASFLHIRDGRDAIPHARFNESFMMHASTSPLYTIIVSNDITAAMMDGPGGPALTGESIQEAVAFRQTMARVHRQCSDKGDWFFNTWNADTVTDPKSGRAIRFEDAPAELLASEPGCWVLHPGDSWHGFGDLEAGYCMLDPSKVSVVTPGVAEYGGLDARGIPATLVTAYLHRRGVEVEKTTDFTILFLFSIGITKGKWGTLLNALLEFKRDYDRNAPLADVLPGLVADHPDAYTGLGLRELADRMFAQLAESRQTHWLAEAFSTLPAQVMSPNGAYQQLVRNQIEDGEYLVQCLTKEASHAG
jgi:arginine/lysine/ornithine decarboxylase